MPPIERTTVRIPDHLANTARIVAALQGKSLAALVEEIMGPELIRREKELLARRTKEVEAADVASLPKIGKRGRPKKERPT